MRPAPTKYNYKSRIQMKRHQVAKPSPRSPVIISHYKFRNHCAQHKKINFIDHIVWINLACSKNRFDQMNTLLNSLTIPHTRIEAVNGKDANFIKMYNHSKINPSEVACCLSHLKAIASLKNIQGNYFMICEDDISFENLQFFDITLFDIIKNAPSFDILMIYHSFPNDLKYEYTDWREFEMKNKIQIAGAVCYIISKSCISKFPTIHGNQLPADFDVADRFIFRHAKTIVYKYNFISTQCKDSTIHEDHLIDHRKWRENELNNIKKNLALINHRYKSCNIYIHHYSLNYKDVLKNFSEYTIVSQKSIADIIIYHEQDDHLFEHNQKYSILIKSSQQTYMHPYNCILNQDSELIIPQDDYLKFANWLIVN